MKSRLKIMVKRHGLMNVIAGFITMPIWLPIVFGLRITGRAMVIAGTWIEEKV